MSTVTIKAFHGDEIRRFNFPSDLSFTAVEKKIAETFKLPLDALVLKHVDEDEDQVTISCDEDLQDALSICKASILKVYVSVGKYGTGSKHDSFTLVHMPLKEVEDKASTPLDEVEVKDADVKVEEVVSEVQPEKSPEDGVVVISPVEVDNDVFELKPVEEVEVVQPVEEAKVEVEEVEVVQPVKEAQVEVDEEPSCAVDMCSEEVCDNEAVEECEGKPAENELPSLPVHIGVTCDVCKAYPIQGVRFKCMVCDNFDLCSKCESDGSHPVVHALLKIKVPKVISSEPLSSSLPKPFSASKPQKLFAKFIQDVSIPDRSTCAPGDVKVKTWKIQNSGSFAWPAGFRILHTSGDRSIVDSQSLEADLPAVAAGQVVDVSVNIIVPTKPGRYIAYFRLGDLKGDKFGPRFWVDFFVPECPKVSEKKEEAVVEAVKENEQMDPNLLKFAPQLAELAEMGFKDESLNLFLVDKFNGNVAQVVHWMINQGR